MDLMLLIGPLAPFEKVDLACLLYQRILTTESFQLVVNTFHDKEERENLIHRLGIKNVSGASSEFDLVTDCMILPSHVAIPSSAPSSPNKKVTPVSKRTTPKHNLSISKDGITPGNISPVGGGGTSTSSPHVISRKSSGTFESKGIEGDIILSTPSGEARMSLADENDLTESVMIQSSKTRSSKHQFDMLSTPSSDSPDKSTMGSLDSLQTEYSSITAQQQLQASWN
jgi:hypothetical protein